MTKNIYEGVTGFVYKAESEQAAVTTLLKLRDPARREMMGKYARRYVLRAATLDRTLATFEEMVIARLQISGPVEAQARQLTTST